jgi:DNA topoisomerase-1
LDASSEFWPAQRHAGCSLNVMAEKIRGSQPDAIQSAKDAGLVYTHHDRPGITRKRIGKGFAFFDPHGKLIRDAEVIDRIHSLVIPPAYKDVWINPSPRGHIQAVGKDARGRTQYRYHPKWRAVRDESKYGKMIEFGRALPSIRRRVRHDLRLPGLERNKVLAAIVKLLETTLIRVGNEAYAKQNKSFGLTTIRNSHVKVNGSRIHFEFRGKSGVEHAIDLQDVRLAKVIRSCQELPEQDLFEYVDHDGSRHSISSSDVNAYLKEISQKDFTAKDFRTWAGTVAAAIALRDFEVFTSQTQAKKNVVAAIETVAKKLGNTKAVCRKCYIHPAVLDAYIDGSLLKALEQKVAANIVRSLHPDEAAVMALLKTKLS